MSRFSQQEQYLVKLDCQFSWQVQHFVKIWEIAGVQSVVFFHTKCASKMGQRRVRDDDLMLGLSSDCRGIVFILVEAIHGFPAEILKSEFFGGCLLLLRAL